MRRSDLLAKQSTRYIRQTVLTLREQARSHRVGGVFKIGVVTGMSST
jgi:hypothetical protein